MALRNYIFLALLMLCGFIVVGQLYITIPLVSKIADDFSVTPSNAAFVGSAFGFAYAAGFLILGPLTDRYSRKTVILSGLALTALATVLVATASSFALLLTFRALQGFAASLFPPAALSLIAEDLPPAQRPLGISLMSFAFLGAAPLAQFFAEAIGDLPLITFSVIALYLIGAIGLLFTAKGNSGHKKPTTTSNTKTGFRALLALPIIPSAWLAAFTVLFGFVIFHGGAQALNSSIGVNLQSLRLVGLPPLLLTLATAPITRRFGPSVTARIGLTIMVAAMAFATIGTANAVLIASAVLSSGVALVVPGLIAIIAGAATNDNRGLALAIYTFSLFVGASIAAPTAQLLAAHGLGLTWGLPAILLAISVFAITLSISRHPLSTS